MYQSVHHEDQKVEDHAKNDTIPYLKNLTESKSDMLLDNIWTMLPLVVQLDRIHGSDPWGRGFESLRAGQMLPKRCPFFLKVL